MTMLCFHRGLKRILLRKPQGARPALGGEPTPAARRTVAPEAGGPEVLARAEAQARAEVPEQAETRVRAALRLQEGPPETAPLIAAETAEWTVRSGPLEEAEWTEG